MRYEKTKFLENKGGVKMIAHRGLSGILLENSLPAFELAGQKSYYGIETDVHITKDGKYIIFHDDDLKRIVGLDMVIEETDYEALRALRFKDTYGDSDKEDMFLPSLEEYLETCKKYDKQAILELKNKMHPKDVLGIATTVKNSGWFTRTTFISFSSENLVELRKAYPMADVQYLLGVMSEQEFQFVVENRLDVDICWPNLTKEQVERLHEEGLKVNCWTVDDEEGAQRMLDYGVDFITTNILE